MAILDAAADLATFLASAGLGLTKGTNLFNAPMPETESEVPDQCVSLVDTGGERPENYLGAGAYLQPTVQVRVRSGVEDFQGGQALALNLLGTINRATITGYAFVVVDESSANYFGPDHGGRHQWGFNVSMGYSAGA